MRLPGREPLGEALGRALPRDGRGIGGGHPRLLDTRRWPRGGAGAASERRTTSREGAPAISTTKIPAKAPPATPIHRWPDEPAGELAVSTVNESSGSQKNLAGQLGPRRSARRACAATSRAETSGNPASSTTASPNCTGLDGSNASSTLLPPR